MSNRILRVNQLIKQELSKIILKEIEFLSGVLVTITRVQTSPNLIQAKVYISVMPENKTKKTLQILDQGIYQLQQRLNQRLRMRPVPRISFTEEKETLKAGRIEEILEEIKEKRG